MKPLQITPQQVRQLFEVGDQTVKNIIKDNWPEMFFELENGQWYVSENKIVVFKTSSKTAYGFDSDGNWMPEKKGFEFGELGMSLFKWRLAKESDYVERLTKEASARGLVDGANIKSDFAGWTKRNKLCVSIHDIGKSNYVWSEHNNGFMAFGVLVMKGGNWVKLDTGMPKSLQTAIDKLGKERIIELLKDKP